MTYTVVISAAARREIFAQARYIAIDANAPLNASRWLGVVWSVILDLESLPRRHPLAAENAFRPYEVRRVLIGSFRILFTVNDLAQQVIVIGGRHAGASASARRLASQTLSRRA